MEANPMIEYSLLFEKIAMLIIIVLGISLFVIELQLRKLRTGEDSIGKNINMDETVLYKEEKLLKQEILDLKSDLSNLRRTN
jgi:hypothetical protein